MLRFAPKLGKPTESYEPETDWPSGLFPELREVELGEEQQQLYAILKTGNRDKYPENSMRHSRDCGAMRSLEIMLAMIVINIAFLIKFFYFFLFSGNSQL